MSRPGPPLMLTSTSSSRAKISSFSSLPSEGVDARPADHRVVVGAPADVVGAGAAVEGVVRLLPAEDVVPEPAVDRVGLRAAAQERLVARAAGDHDRAEEVQPGSGLAAAVEVVVTAEQVHLELERTGREGDVDVAVGARGEAVLAGGHVVGSLGAVDDDAVGRVAERGDDLDLGRVRLGGRTGAEETAALVEDQRLVGAGRSRDRDRVGVGRRRGAARDGGRAEQELAAGDDERRLRAARDVAVTAFVAAS